MAKKAATVGDVRTRASKQASLQADEFSKIGCFVAVVGHCMHTKKGGEEQFPRVERGLTGPFWSVALV